MRNPVLKPIFLEREELERFESNLPRNVSLAEAIRALILEDNKKNPEASYDLSAISSNRNTDMGINEDLRSHLGGIRLINDVQELREINLTGQEITKITGTRLGQLLKKDENTSNRLLSFTYDREQLRESLNTTER